MLKNLWLNGLQNQKLVLLWFCSKEPFKLLNFLRMLGCYWGHGPLDHHPEHLNNRIATVHTPLDWVVDKHLPQISVFLEQLPSLFRSTLNKYLAGHFRYSMCLNTFCTLDKLTKQALVMHLYNLINSFIYGIVNRWPWCSGTNISQLWTKCSHDNKCT